jgi:phosphate transporter
MCQSIPFSSFVQDDFEQFLWSVVFLAMGGIALGKGVTSSGLLDNMDVLIRALVNGRSEIGVVVVLTTVVLVSDICRWGATTFSR